MTKAFFRFLALSLFMLILSGQQSFASFRCQGIFLLAPNIHASEFGRQVVFSSTKIDQIFSNLRQTTRTTSNAAALFYLKGKRIREFTALQNRIDMAADTISTLADYGFFKNYSEHAKSLLYQELTEVLLATGEAKGVQALLHYDDLLYFPPIPNDSGIAFLLKATRHLRENGNIDSSDRERLNDFMQTFYPKVSANQQKFLRIDNQFALIQLTYKKGASRAEEITNYALNLFNALTAYDLSLVLRVNDVSTSEADYVNTQLSAAIARLQSVYSQLSPEQRLALQTDHVMERLARYQRKLQNEISLYPERENESLRLAAVYRRMTKPATSSLPGDLY